MSESTEAASFLSEGTGSRTGLHPMSPDWCTLSRVSYAAQLRYWKTALKLKKKGHSLEDIAECLDFDVETVRKWLVS